MGQRLGSVKDLREAGGRLGRIHGLRAVFEADDEERLPESRAASSGKADRTGDPVAALIEARASAGRIGVAAEAVVDQERDECFARRRQMRAHQRCRIASEPRLGKSPKGRIAIEIDGIRLPDGGVDQLPELILLLGAPPLDAAAQRGGAGDDSEEQQAARQDLLFPFCSYLM